MGRRLRTLSAGDPPGNLCQDPVDDIAAMVRTVAQRVTDRRFAQRKHASPLRACEARWAMTHTLVRLLVGGADERHALQDLLTQSP